jgi:predicted nucleotidyltransferase
MERVPGVNPDLLQEIVRRIVEVAQPERIILFGSAARGEVGPHSDVDLLIVKSGAHRGKLTEEIYLHLFGVGVAVDAIVVTPEDLERYAASPALVIRPALAEGKVVYEAPREVLPG